MTRLPEDASCATVSAIDCGNPTDPGEGTPNPSLVAGCVTMPVAAVPPGRTTLIAVPTGIPFGMSIGTDHHPAGSCGVCDSTDLMSGSPAPMSVVADTPTITG
jgi:hypothetical protein